MSSSPPSWEVILRAERSGEVLAQGFEFLLVGSFESLSLFLRKRALVYDGTFDLNPSAVRILEENGCQGSTSTPVPRLYPSTLVKH